MKRLIYFFSLVLCLGLTSCGDPMQKLEDLLDELKSEGKNMDVEQWENFYRSVAEAQLSFWQSNPTKSEINKFDKLGEKFSDQVRKISEKEKAEKNMKKAQKNLNKDDEFLDLNDDISCARKKAMRRADNNKKGGKDDDDDDDEDDE